MLLTQSRTPQSRKPTVPSHRTQKNGPERNPEPPVLKAGASRGSFKLPFRRIGSQTRGSTFKIFSGVWDPLLGSLKGTLNLNPYKHFHSNASRSRKGTLITLRLDSLKGHPHNNPLDPLKDPAIPRTPSSQARATCLESTRPPWRTTRIRGNPLEVCKQVSKYVCIVTYVHVCLGFRVCMCMYAWIHMFMYA